MWERYCRGVSAIVYVVDSAAPDSLKQAKDELHELCAKDTLKGIPLLVLANKNDLKEALDVQQIIDLMDLKSIQGREVSCYSISAKKAINIEKTLDWLLKHGKKNKDSK